MGAIINGVDLCSSQLQLENTVTGKGILPAINASNNSPKQFIIYGNSFQNTRSGKNLYNYKDTTTVTSGVTADEDGWITVNGDNKIRTYYDYYTHNLNLKENTQYLIVLEVKEISGNGFLRVTSSQSNSGQVKTSFGYDNFNVLKNGDIETKIVYTKEDFSSLNSNGLRTYVAFGEGQSGSITFRISVLEDTSITPEQFMYEPYGAMPSPEFPSEIKCVEGLGNLFDLDRFIEEYNKVATSPSYKENGFDYFSYGDVSHTGAFAFKFMQGEFKENTQYTLCVKGFVNNYASGNFTGFIFYYTDNTHSEVRLNSGNLSNYTFSSTANKTVNYIGLNSSGGKGMFVKDICLYEDNMQLPYLPYGKNYLKLADTGKNLFSSWIKGISFDGNGRQISSTKGAGTDYIPIDFNINQNYTISNITENLALRFYAYNKSKEFIGMSSPNYVNELSFNHDIIGLTSGHTFGEIAYMRFELFQSASVSGNIDEVDNLLTQLECGSVVTEYQQYKRKDQLIDLSGVILNRIDEYCDYVDLASGKGIRRIGEYICTGDEDISFESNPDSNYIRARFPMDNVSKEKKRQPILSNYFKYALSIHDVGTGFISLGYFYFYLPKEYTTKEQYTQWLKDRYNEGNPLKIYYVLETPEEITTEPVNIQLFNQINNLRLYSNVDANMLLDYYTIARGDRGDKGERGDRGEKGDKGDTGEGLIYGATESGDFNTLIPNDPTMPLHLYIASTDFLNQPCYNCGWLDSYMLSTNSIKQIFIPDQGPIHLRSCIEGYWEQWQSVVTSTNDNTKYGNNKKTDVIDVTVTDGWARTIYGSDCIILSAVMSDKNGYCIPYFAPMANYRCWYFRCFKQTDEILDNCTTTFIVTYINNFADWPGIK